MTEAPEIGNGTSVKRDWLLGLLLVLAVVVVYQPVWHAGFIWDDDVYVTNNPLLFAPDGLRRIWFSLDSPSQYFPLTYTAFRLEYALWGLNPAGYHWVNILLHAGNTLLVWWLLRRLAVPGAWLAAALWALHPVQVETVAWITELKNVLMLFFFLLSLLAWIKFVEPLVVRPWKYYALALAFFALALAAKTTACTLPAALLLILWWQHQPITRARVAQVIPFLALGLGMGLVTVWWERFHQGTQGPQFAMGMTERMLVASHALWFYAGKLVWPVNLTFSYPRWTINPANPLAYGWLLAGAAGAGIVYYFRRMAGRGPEVALLFFALTLSPLLGFIMLYTFRYTFVADHYQYVACIGLITVVAAGITIAFKSRPRLKLAICGALLLTLGALTWQQAKNFQNPETLWRDTLLKNPDCWLAETSLGGLLINQGNIAGAMKYCLKAVRLNPESYEAQNDLGIALAASGRIDEAIQCYRRAIRINPSFAEALNDLGVALAASGQPDEAIASYDQAIQINPGYDEAINNLGAALSTRGRFSEAITNFDRAIALNPKQPETFFRRALAFSQMGRTAEAVASYRAALNLNPDLPEALNNLAWLLATSSNNRLRNGAEASRLAKRACEISQYQQPAYIGTLAAACAEAGRFDEAVANARAARNLAQSLGKPSLALEELRLMKLFQTHHACREKLESQGQLNK